MTSTAVQAAPAGRRAHAPGARIQTTGLVLLALAPLVMFAAGAMTGADLGEGMAFLVIGAVLAVAAGLSVAYGTWSKVVGLVLTALATLAGFWLAFGLALVGSLAANLLTRSSVAVADAEGVPTIEMVAFEFPTATAVAAGADARLVVHNADAFLHDIAIPAADLGPVTIAPGSQALVDVSSLAPGSYTYYCTLHSDTSIADPEEAGMAGTLVVE